jgi:hypothetical protein
MQAFMTLKYRVQACNKREVRRLIDLFVERASNCCIFAIFTRFIPFENRHDIWQSRGLLLQYF